MKVVLTEKCNFQNKGTYKITDITPDEAINILADDFDSSIENRYIKEIADRLLLLDTKFTKEFNYYEIHQKVVLIIINASSVIFPKDMSIDELKSITKFKLIERIE